MKQEETTTKLYTDRVEVNGVSCPKNSMTLMVVFVDEDGKSATFGRATTFDDRNSFSKEEMRDIIQLTAEALIMSSKIHIDKFSKEIIYEGPILKAIEKKTSLLS